MDDLLNEARHLVDKLREQGPEIEKIILAKVTEQIATHPGKQFLDRIGFVQACVRAGLGNFVVAIKEEVLNDAEQLAELRVDVLRAVSSDFDSLITGRKEMLAQKQ